MRKHKNQDEEIWGGPGEYQPMNHIGTLYVMAWIFWILMIVGLQISFGVKG